MNKPIANLILAILLILISLFSGFPPQWNYFFILILSLIIGFVSVLMYREDRAKNTLDNVNERKNTEEIKV